MIIPTEILEKYNMLELDWYKEQFGDSTDTEKNFYKTFLIQTDHITNKLVEGAIKTEDCTDELYYREVARQEIARLNGETPAAVENRKTLEERATQNEADTAFIAMMSDIDLEG